MSSGCDACGLPQSAVSRQFLACPELAGCCYVYKRKDSEVRLDGGRRREVWCRMGMRLESREGLLCADSWLRGCRTLHRSSVERPHSPQVSFGKWSKGAWRARLFKTPARRHRESVDLEVYTQPGCALTPPQSASTPPLPASQITLRRYEHPRAVLPAILVNITLPNCTCLDTKSFYSSGHQGRFGHEFLGQSIFARFRVRQINFS